VRHDVITHLARLVPGRPDFRHMEGNSDAHIKTAMMGASQTVPLDGGRMTLGTWQAIYLCEFDGPRTRRVLVKVLA
jgi:secondary thiamine-phosphate synthase enzyme